MEQVLHTFAICAYGESPYLSQCIRSLKLQKVRSEIILCAAEESAFLREMSERFDIPLFIRGGAPDIREDWLFAWRCARGRFVTLAHQDDIYRKNYTEELIRAYGRFPDMSVFVSDYMTIRMENGRAVDDTLNAVWLVKKVLRVPLRLRGLADLSAIKKSGVIFGNALCCPTCTYRKEWFGDEMFLSGYKFALDWENLYRLAGEKGRFVVCEKPLLAYRVHEDAATMRSIRSSERAGEEEAMFRQMLPGKAAEYLMKAYRLAYREYEK